MGFLIDTNVISELRKGKKANAKVRQWFESTDESDIYLSALTLGEIRNGVERLRRRDPASAAVLESWLGQLVESTTDRVLPVTPEIADRWGRLGVPDPLPVIDSLLAATALVHGLILVTRNVSDVERTGVSVFNPF
ncbi:type II toxin-antitoxin system VapC family toxin [uncultured Thiodictyon sp.]|uniref:type II toxin-antitoxin system VapC family toxin n=1 Tax=uncultured Thiodictyon sp. TaxID=1846217 RepID=UPI0025DA5E67|nr:type II toxin-antitoxin system VapC family toxin [uncultured Thiodictyon sp.]